SVSQKKKDSKEKQAGKDSFPIVCLGASAGGLKSLEAFLSNVPQKSGIAFVIISHSDPGQDQQRVSGDQSYGNTVEPTFSAEGYFHGCFRGGTGPSRKKR
ncbi:MAG: hypothetical protein KJN62_01545, partial [Deltaproteobacteria bacterium]|nr:hypothetical protein [Deltaproteobacteria bacterium]